MNTLENLLSVFERGEWLSARGVAKRLRSSPKPPKSVDMLSYARSLLSIHSELFNRKRNSSLLLHCRNSKGDLAMSDEFLDELIVLAIPESGYTSLRVIQSRTRLWSDKLKERLEVLVQTSKVLRKPTGGEAHYMRVQNKPPPKVQPKPDRSNHNLALGVIKRRPK
jgi:hypothetical protein